MLTHAPDGYICPFCRIVGGDYGEGVATREADVVFRRPTVTAFIASHWWPNNQGHVIVVPNQHYENIYDLPLEFAGQVHTAARDVALAMKHTYPCAGISTRQHNEPAGNQDIWHYHLHVFPRYDGDNLYITARRPTTIDERVPFAEKLRDGLNRILV